MASWPAPRCTMSPTWPMCRIGCRRCWHPRGRIVVVEWARERFDEATARWCFDRLPEPEADRPGWLHDRQAEWAASRQSWDACLRSWAEADGPHTAQAIL